MKKGQIRLAGVLLWVGTGWLGGSVAMAQGVSIDAPMRALQKDRPQQGDCADACEIEEEEIKGLMDVAGKSRSGPEYSAQRGSSPMESGQDDPVSVLPLSLNSVAPAATSAVPALGAVALPGALQ